MTAVRRSSARGRAAAPTWLKSSAGRDRCRPCAPSSHRKLPGFRKVSFCARKLDPTDCHSATYRINALEQSMVTCQARCEQRCAEYGALEHKGGTLCHTTDC